MKYITCLLLLLITLSAASEASFKAGVFEQAVEVWKQGNLPLAFQLAADRLSFLIKEEKQMKNYDFEQPWMKVR
jgi:hypothetical protein